MRQVNIGGVLVIQHGTYHAFNISDPKSRNIHKASVRDRLLHHAIHRKLYPFFDKKFISDSYSCRVGKGTHRAIDRFRAYAYCVSRNHTHTVWTLKCDIRKFFASVDQRILLDIIVRHIHDPDTAWLVGQIVSSFNSGKSCKGLPLGNLTSQLLANIYMNEFDQFVKHTLKAKHYVRYADDFMFLSRDEEWLASFIPRIAEFLKLRLALSLHPNKVSIKSFASGVDFLGWIHFSITTVFYEPLSNERCCGWWKKRKKEKKSCSHTSDYSCMETLRNYEHKSKEWSRKNNGESHARLRAGFGAYAWEPRFLACGTLPPLVSEASNNSPATKGFLM